MLLRQRPPGSRIVSQSMLPRSASGAKRAALFDTFTCRWGFNRSCLSDAKTLKGRRARTGEELVNSDGDL